MTPISMSKQYTTRDGRPVRLLCVDGPGDCPVIGLIGKRLHRWHVDGRWAEFCQSPNDLIEAKPRVQCTVQLRRRFDGVIFASTERQTYDPKFLKEVARVTIDVEEGHGLGDQP